MIFDYVGGTKDLLKQDPALKFCRNENKVISILTETHMDYDQMHPIRNSWLNPIFFSPGDSHTKGLLVLLRLGLEIGIDPKGRVVSFRVTPSTDRVLYLYAPSGYSTWEQLARECLFKGLQKYLWKKIWGKWK